jgi:putative FmdB family regulatory protein
MPIFDYKCDKCEQVEEHLVSKYDVIVICDKCGIDMTKQFTSTFSFNLKGDGFYKQGFSSYKVNK